MEEAAHVDNSSSFTIDVNDAGVLTYTFTNQRLATLRVTKTGTNNAALDGVVFELRDAAGGLLDTQTTVGGLAQFAYLEVGETYTVREIKTISGYQLNEEVLTFTVDAANLVIDRTIVNYERIDELPATGTPARLVLWLCGGVLILSFFVRTVLMRKRGIY